jgi:apolipoprotein N-acyltransferase
MRWFDSLARLAGWRRHAAAAALGALSALALPPLHGLPLLLLALPGLLALIDGGSWRKAAWAGFWFGFGHHLVGLYWITDAILIEADQFWWVVPFAVPGLSAVLAVFVAVPCALATRAAPGWRRALVLAGAWVLADLLRQFTATGFPWNPIGSVWAVPGGFGDVFIQPAAWISVHGLTLLTLLLAMTPALGRRGMAAGVVVLGAWGGFGAWRLAEPAPKPPGLAVVLVQGDIPQGQKFNRDFAIRTFETHLALTRKGAVALAGRPGVVLWPETASVFQLQTDAAARQAVAEAAGVPVLAGTIRFDEAGRPRNSMVVVDGPGPAEAFYDKAHLVPFGEYQPTWIPLSFRAMPGDGFAAGPGPVTLHLRGLPPVGPLICYEAIFPAAVVDRADRPAWMANITNDAWFGNSSGPRQHLAAARMRAVEEGLPLMRAANTGISAGFDAKGHELGRLGMGVSGELVLDLPGALPPTLFARHGLAIPLGLAVLVVLIGLLPRRLSSREIR